jgi:hypothetical protein
MSNGRFIKNNNSNIHLAVVYLKKKKKRICWLTVGVMLNTSAAFSPQGIFVFFKISTYECTITLCLRKTAMSEYRNVGVRNQLIA